MNNAFLEFEFLPYSGVLAAMALILFFIPKQLKSIIFYVFLSLKFIATAFFVYFLSGKRILIAMDLGYILTIYFLATAIFFIIYQAKSKKDENN